MRVDPCRWVPYATNATANFLKKACSIARIAPAQLERPRVRRWLGFSCKRRVKGFVDEPASVEHRGAGSVRWLRGRCVRRSSDLLEGATGGLGSEHELLGFAPTAPPISSPQATGRGRMQSCKTILHL
jgi:hypothetical protein